MSGTEKHEQAKIMTVEFYPLAANSSALYPRTKYASRKAGVFSIIAGPLKGGGSIGTWLFMLAALFILGPAGCSKRIVTSSSRPTVESRPYVPYTGTTKPYTINGKTYYPLTSAQGFSETGLASWYGEPFHGRKTASGEIYNMYAMTAAHTRLPMGTPVRVTELSTGRYIVVRVNDRGPFGPGRIIDLSRKAAETLGMVDKGLTRVRVQALSALPKEKETDFQGAFYVQVASFLDKNKAQRLADRVSRHYSGKGRVRSTIVRGQRWWQVHVGAYRGLAAARDALQGLKREYPECFVIAD